MVMAVTFPNTQGLGPISVTCNGRIILHQWTVMMKHGQWCSSSVNRLEPYVLYVILPSICSGDTHLCSWWLCPPPVFSLIHSVLTANICCAYATHKILMVSMWECTICPRTANCYCNLQMYRAT